MDRTRKQQLSKLDKSNAQKLLTPRQPKTERNVRNVKAAGKLLLLEEHRARQLEVLQMQMESGGNWLRVELRSNVLERMRAMMRTMRNKVRI
jgi:hypothetical protein